MLHSHLYLKSFQVASLEQMLSTGRQSENETDPDPRQFQNWKGTGAAKILLPDV